MLTVDMILAMSEDELRANYTKAELVACVVNAEVYLAMADADFVEADSNLSALAAETVPESTGTAVDEVYDFEVRLLTECWECETEPYFGQQAYDRFAAFDELCREYWVQMHPGASYRPGIDPEPAPPPVYPYDRASR